MKFDLIARATEDKKVARRQREGSRGEGGVVRAGVESLEAPLGAPWLLLSSWRCGVVGGRWAEGYGQYQT
jgi:hypothetical protein